MLYSEKGVLHFQFGASKDNTYLHSNMSVIKKQRIDLNCDMGELHPITGLNYDNEIMPYISSSNICCGVHSGSLALSEKTIELAIKNDVVIGAHPSYDDRENFGRNTPKVDIDDLCQEITDQIISIKILAEKKGSTLHHVKPHGALYNDLAKDETLSNTFVKLLKAIDPRLKIYGLANSTFEKVCLSHDINFVKEVFADRKYADQNTLLSRQKEGAVIYNINEILTQVDQLLSGTIIDFRGQKHSVQADTICLHSDTEGAIILAQDISRHLKNKGIEILPS